jgi:hypothetical protein
MCRSSTGAEGGDKGKPVARNNENKWKAKGIKVSSLKGWVTSSEVPESNVIQEPLI